MIDFSTAQYRAILDYMLSQIPDDYDKRDTSPIPTALSPAAYVFEGFFLSLNMVQRQAFFQTATGSALDLLAPIASVIRKQATAAVRKGEFNMAIPLGSRFSTINGAYSINFVALSALGSGHTYRLLAETPGTIGNDYTGPILPIDTIQGLTSARISDILTPGDETETDDEFRARIEAALNSRSFGGNVAQYVEEIEKLDGVGTVQVYPTWRGGGTVLCSVPGCRLAACIHRPCADYSECHRPVSELRAGARSCAHRCKGNDHGPGEAGNFGHRIGDAPAQLLAGYSSHRGTGGAGGISAQCTKKLGDQYQQDRH